MRKLQFMIVPAMLALVLASVVYHVCLAVFPFGNDNFTIQEIDLVQLENLTRDDPFVGYAGAHSNFHYFETLSGDRFRVPHSDELPPLDTAAHPNDGTILFVAIRNGKVSPSRPELLQDIAADQQSKGFRSDRWPAGNDQEKKFPIVWMWMCSHERCFWSQEATGDADLENEHTEHNGDVILVPMPGSDQPKWAIGPGLSDAPGVDVTFARLEGTWKAVSPTHQTTLKISTDQSGQTELKFNDDTFVESGKWRIENSSHICFQTEQSESAMYSVRHLSEKRLVLLEFDNEIPLVFQRADAQQ